MTKVTIVAKPAGEALNLTIALANELDVPIFVFSNLWIYGENGNQELDPQHVYTSINRKGELTLGKIVYPVPKEIFVESQAIPFAIKLEGRKSSSESFQLRLPIREHSPYYLSEDASMWDEISISTIQCFVEYFVDVDGLKLHEAPFPNSFRLEHPKLMQSIVRAKSDPIAVDIRGLRRADKFERFTSESR